MNASFPCRIVYMFIIIRAYSQVYRLVWFFKYKVLKKNVNTTFMMLPHIVIMGVTRARFLRGLKL